MNKTLIQVVISAAGPARHVSALIQQLLDRQLDVQAVVTLSASGRVVTVPKKPRSTLDTAYLETICGQSIISDFSPPGRPRLSSPDATFIIAIPDVVEKLALAVSDTYVTATLSEAIGNQSQIFLCPPAGSSDATCEVFKHCAQLGEQGVHILPELGGCQNAIFSSIELTAVSFYRV